MLLYPEDDVCLCLSSCAQVENISLLPNSPANGFVGVNMYCDDQVITEHGNVNTTCMLRGLAVTAGRYVVGQAGRTALTLLLLLLLLLDPGVKRVPLPCYTVTLNTGDVPRNAWLCARSTTHMCSGLPPMHPCMNDLPASCTQAQLKELPRNPRASAIAECCGKLIEASGSMGTGGRGRL